MSHSNERELQLLRKHLLALVSEESPIAGRSINDLFLQADCDTGVLRLFDDEDQEISHVPVFAWAETGAGDVSVISARCGFCVTETKKTRFLGTKHCLCYEKILFLPHEHDSCVEFGFEIDRSMCHATEFCRLLRLGAVIQGQLDRAAREEKTPSCSL